MPKAIAGAVLLGAGAIAATVLTGGFALPGILALSSTAVNALGALAVGGLSLEAGAIADALTSNRGTNITTRQAASFRQIIVGEQRVGGVDIYESTTGSHHNQYNYCIVVAAHTIDSFVNLYLDGRQVFWNPTNANGNTTRNGVNFGGAAASGNHTGPGGQQYNFGGLVYCEARFGDQAAGDVILGFTANDPAWAATSAGSPYVGGCAYFYLKVQYDTNMFANKPEVRVTVRGKNDILDPRTGLRGYTNNWALLVADVLTDARFNQGGGGVVNQVQLIAAANVCDEQVALAAGGTEARYALNWHYDTSTAPGDVLQAMMSAAGGRFSEIGGEYYLWPAYWQGPSFDFDADALADGYTWTPQRSSRDIFNRVTGTYTAPNYPYNTAGNLYDANGFYQGSIQNNFGFAFQTTSFPPYACDVLHGYAADQYLAEDGGRFLSKEMGLPTVLSIAQAQRLAKIDLLRNRHQGSGSFVMFPAAYQMQPIDVMHFTFPQEGWTAKVLEVNSVTFSIAEGPNKVPRITVQVGVNETAASVYEWDASEELTVYDVAASPQQASPIPAPPRNMVLTSSAATAIHGVDGVVRPRVMVSWDEPLDGFVQQVQVQSKATASATWTDGGFVGVQSVVAYVQDVIAGGQYDFRIRSLRANGAASPWLEVDAYTVSLVLSTVTSAGMNPNSPYNVSNNVSVDSIVEGDAATIRIYGPGGDGSSFSRYVGSTATTMSAAHLTGQAFSTFYYVVYDTLAAAYLALGDYNSTLADHYVPIGAVLTCTPAYPGTGTGGGTPGGGGESPGGGRNYDLTALSSES